MDLSDEVVRKSCESFDIGDGEWKYAGRWITEWVWEPDRQPSPIGEGTVVFFDRDKDDRASGPVVVGFVAWNLRKERVRGPKEYVGVVHLISVAPDYRGRKTTDGPSVASSMFATAEKVMRDHEKGSDEMPLRIDVNVGNEHARAIYTKCWGFTHWKWRPKPPAEPQYEVLLRKPSRSSRGEFRPTSGQRAQIEADESWTAKKT